MFQYHLSIDLVEYNLEFYNNRAMSLQAADSPQPVMSWTVHLARRQPAKTLICVAFIAAVSAGGYFAISPYAAALVCAALAASLSDFLFPIRFIIWEDRVGCRMLLKSAEIKWTKVKRCYLDDYGVKLSPLGRASRLEAFRGVYLRFANNENEVIETVKALRPSDV